MNPVDSLFLPYYERDDHSGESLPSPEDAIALSILSSQRRGYVKIPAPASFAKRGPRSARRGVYPIGAGGLTRSDGGLLEKDPEAQEGEEGDAADKEVKC
jgi:hypothetical protein